jgi:hypothetical protein
LTRTEPHIGSDARNTDPDYSAAYCILHTDRALEGHGLIFSMEDIQSRELCRKAIAQGWTHFSIKVGADREGGTRWRNRFLSDHCTNIFWDPAHLSNGRYMPPSGRNIASR